MLLPAATPFIAAGCAVAGGLALLAGILSRRRRRAAARAAYERAPVPTLWEFILRRRLPVYARLPEEMRCRLHRWMKVFLAEKHFTACGGIAKVTDAMAVTIAAHACLLLVGRERGGCFPSVESVLVYPDWFYSKARHYNPASGAEIVGMEARVGEASPMGSVVLSWREVLQASAFPGNTRNVVLHEFAHHIQPAGSTLFAELERGFRALAAAPDADPVLDSYGAENRDEFWTVSVETFFEAPLRLREAHPAWYAALAKYFATDPAEWGDLA